MLTFSQNKVKLINSLRLKKYRLQQRLFVIEGEKMVEELLVSSLKVELICATEDWMIKNRDALYKNNIDTISITLEDLKKISSLETPNKVLAVTRIPESHFDITKYSDDLIIMLDSVQDPGNMGTLIRLADWFGISTIICSPGCVDVYNPKVVQATMGSILRIKIYSMELKEVLSSYTFKDVPVYGTSLNGTNIYNEKLSPSGILIFGNESKGISKEVMKYVNKELFIPSFNSDKNIAESLNVAVAAGIVCSEFKRRG